MLIKTPIYVLRAIGIGGILRALQNTFAKRSIDKHYSTQGTPAVAYSPGTLHSINPIKSGVRVDFDHSNVEIVFLSEHIIRVSWEPGVAPIPYTLAKDDWIIQQPALQINTNSFSISLGSIKITSDQYGEIIYQDDKQKIFRHDNPPGFMGNKVELSTILAPEEHIYGLGERAAGLNLRPGRYHSWNTDVKGRYSTGTDPLYICTPIYLSLSSAGSYLAYYENSFRSSWVIGDRLETIFDGGMLRYYLIFGSIDIIYQQLSELVGRPFMPPRWVLGYHQSRWGYKNENEIRNIASGFAEHDLPISAIHLDIDYMDGFRLFTINKQRFPDMKTLSADLAKKGIRLVATINPAVKSDPNYGLFSGGLQKDVYCKLPDNQITGGVSWPGWSVFPDFTNPDVRRWWQDQYNTLIDAGIAGFWHDMNEPASFSAGSDMTFPKATCHDFDRRGGDHLEAHNLYGFLMNRAAFEGILKYAPGKRPWIFSRSGWAGLQRYAWNWTGDIETSWQSLKQTIPTILGLSLSGHAFSGADIGGFSGNPDAELYLRWFQMSAFLPIFRTHSAIGTKRREPWVFGESVTKIIRNFLILRYKLLPYWYTLAWETAKSGIPPIRPIFWCNPEDPSFWDTDDEFLLGNRLLIAPVLKRGAKSRLITLPAGKWYSFWDDQEYDGPTKFYADLSFDTIPIFVNAGSILPLEEDSGISLHVYPSDDAESQDHIYSDSGDGYGLYRIDKFTSRYQGTMLEVLWDEEGLYPFPYTNVRLIVHGRKLTRTAIDNKSYSVVGNSVQAEKFRSAKLFF